MRKVALLFIFQFIVVALFAQRPENRAPRMKEHVHPVKDKKVINGFEVRLRHTPTNYQYMIFRDKKPVPIREHNPELLMMQGFDSKDDAFKVAAWAIKEQKKTGYFPSMIPPHVAKELEIDIHPKPKKH